ncbi:acyltransferase [Vibrio splendidus]|uniref:acyltransferase n=1 Tax=Vibrio splendidus TaxID=29497 RepID=UPI00352CBF60
MIGRFRFILSMVIKKAIGLLRLKGAERQAKRAAGSFSYTAQPRINVPIRCDGAGRVYLSEEVNLGYRRAPMLGNGEVLLQARTPESLISIGSKTTTSNNISIVSCSRVKIGNSCQIGDLVSIYDCDFHEINPETRNQSPGISLPVVIGNNVWLGSRVMVLKGVKIGDHSVVAAGSVVTSSIPERSLVAGVPAKIIRKI